MTKIIKGLSAITTKGRYNLHEMSVGDCKFYPSSQFSEVNLRQMCYYTDKSVRTKNMKFSTKYLAAGSGVGGFMAKEAGTLVQRVK